ncbi:MAG: hypothetical protein ABSB30_02370 [Terracidiphilus sp.]|jgi:phosphoribosylformylglycinamidine (FGAM) synthase-like amidotransferase family enzyme
MKSGALVFSGSNCDHDIYNVFAEAACHSYFFSRDSEDRSQND